MSDLSTLGSTKVSGLPQATLPIGLSDIVLVVQDGVTRRTTVGAVYQSAVSPPITVAGVSKTLLKADLNQQFVFTSNSSIGVTVDKSAPVGQFILWQIGDGVITVSPGSGASQLSTAINGVTSLKGAPLTVFVVANSDGNSAQYIIIGGI